MPDNVILEELLFTDKANSPINFEIYYGCLFNDILFVPRRI